MSQENLTVMPEKIEAESNGGKKSPSRSVTKKKSDGKGTKKTAKIATKGTSVGRDERGRFTKGNKIGEDTRFELENAAACKYQEKYADELIAFFNKPATRTEYIETFNAKGKVIKRVPVVLPCEYPTFEAFAAQCGVSTRTLQNWCQESRRFADCYARAKELQRAKLVINTLGGSYNPLFAKFEAINNHGMSDKVTTDNTMTFNVNLSDEVDEEAN